MRLKQVDASITRPISDRVKEALFNIIGSDIIGSRMLDMFAGTGSVGVEALSRGASHVVFLDISSKAIEVIHSNLSATKFADIGEPRQTDALEYLGQTGNDVLSGADIIKVAPERYESSIEYADNPISKSLRDVARVHTADVGGRVFYTSHGGYDVHANENPTQPKLIGDLSAAISDFFADLQEHEASDNLVMMVFTEFGRRVPENASGGTDHGTATPVFVIGNRVNGGQYGKPPSLTELDHGNLIYTTDYRRVYASLIEEWMGGDATAILKGEFETLDLFG
mgnify:CR=1 FL=1